MAEVDVHAAMARAQFEYLADDHVYYGEIPDLRGVWADGETLEECRQTLQEALEGWIMVGRAVRPCSAYARRQLGLSDA